MQADGGQETHRFRLMFGTRTVRRFTLQFGVLLLLAAACAAVDSETHKVLIRDIATVEGVRDNSLVGYGLVVGLRGTGDKQQTYFTVQTLASILARMGVEIPPSVLQTTVQVKNVAAVLVTATLPPFSPPGMHLDIMVSSVGDARSLEGGTLVLTPLYAADGQVYAAAQGPVVVGGYAAGAGTNSKQVNHPTVGRVPSGGLIERDSTVDLGKLPELTFVLNDADFTTAEEVAAAINRQWVAPVATAADGRRITIKTSATASMPVPALLAQIENLEVEVQRRAKVVVNERTGTVVMGKDVHLGAVSILHGSFSIEVSTAYTVSQPNAMAAGQTEVVPETRLKATETPARNIELGEGASVEDLVTRLQAIGATARDVVSILQAIKAAGALEAELEVI
ncbi:MAG TPA: flagellar basal body P-ring protein FlgI [Terriglobales bacterium]|nr:flagellar basal body P-ring protein FlgI [Terriglobales bacterium]